MPTNYVRIFSRLVIVLACGVFAAGQDRPNASALSDRYVISARAGAVNYASGAVEVNREGRTLGLSAGDEVEAGERVTTGSNGRTEILLNPGSFMRVDANSSFELKTTSLENLTVKMHAGTAMFEVFASAKFRVEIAAPKGRIFLVESGVYQVSVGSDGSATVRVWEGLARLGDTSLTPVRESRAGTIASGAATVEKFDRGDKTEFVSWSRTRGKELARTTKSIKDKAMTESLLSAYNGGQWGMRNSFGLWVRDAKFGRYCFLPFGWDWYSPYGFWYGNSIYWYNLPPIVYQVQPQAPNPYGVKTRSRVDDNLSESGGVGGPPPFRQMETSRGNSPVRQTPDYTGDRSSAPSSVPVYIPAPVYVPAPGAKGTKP